MSSPHEKEKVNAILEAARKRFGYFGLVKTTMTEIAEDANMSKASLYYYFPDKEHLFVAVIGKEMDAFLEEMQKLSASSESAGKKLNKFVEKRLASFQQFINLGKIAGATYESLKPAFADVHQDFAVRERKIVQDILEAGIHAGEFSTMDTVVTADLFVSTLYGYRTMIIKQRESFLLTAEDYSQLDSYQTYFTRIFIKGITKTAKH